ncbi:hypothetical protein F3Y22_tig00111495pilonHSYRG00092 [Hibiscus syriacus]|uniref:Neprosin PEP catalytic domain-containing protein n=1 Tax=Hibiscus syriacus TaxID=106335 RepID=A0A6A2YKJ6_HIBSY|nr:hypothetical protein F3Y22_tig00111495pilonHSYRG00092 [Hibiscus syriacus]
MAKLNFSCLFLILILSCLSDGSNGKVNLKEVDQKLKKLNKPAVKTIQSEDGDIIDCIDIYKQPAFDHPALKNHVIQMKPSFDIKEEKPSTTDESSKLVVSQTWRRSGSCPEGTVPVRRIRREDLLRANSIDRFGRKPQEIIVSKSNTTNQKDGHFPFINNTRVNFPTMDNRSTAILVTVGFNYIGAKADINVWNPYVEADDNSPRLKSGLNLALLIISNAWNLDGCGFVQTSTEIALEQSLSPSPLGLDPKTKNWWLKYGNDKPVGYWPAATLFTYLTQRATTVEWGGQVYSKTVHTSSHTKTAMGSGDFASVHMGMHVTYEILPSWMTHCLSNIQTGWANGPMNMPSTLFITSKVKELYQFFTLGDLDLNTQGQIVFQWHFMSPKMFLGDVWQWCRMSLCSSSGTQRCIRAWISWRSLDESFIKPSMSKETPNALDRSCHHEVTLFSIQHEIDLLTSLEYLCQIAEAFLKVISRNGEVIHKYFKKILNHVRKDSLHAALKSCRGITESKRHPPESISAKGTHECSILLVLWCDGNLIIPRVFVQ